MRTMFGYSTNLEGYTSRVRIYNVRRNRAVRLGREKLKKTKLLEDYR